MTEYKVESIGASFDASGIAKLSQLLTSRAQDGWEFYDAYQIEKTGCAGLNKSITYIAVYKRESKQPIE